MEQRHKDRCIMLTCNAVARGKTMTRSSSLSSVLVLSALVARASSLATPSSPHPNTNDAVISSSSSKICGARRLGGSDLIVSEACLGTMTFGVQNNQEDAFDQMEYARSSCGVNFLDCAELYPVPLTASEWRAGATEEIVGAYLEHIGPAQRDDLVVATKVAGFFPSSPVAAARMLSPMNSADPMPDCRLDAASVKLACEASLRRLRTDRIDLFQIHWPDRYVPVFGQTVFQPDNKRDDSVPILETASALRDLIEDGKVRYIGISNESTLGVCEWIRATEQLGIRDKLVSIQNSYSLLDRRFDGELAEACDFHGLGLLPWSVLAGGLLSGKYSKNTNTASPSSRFIKYPEYMTRWSPSSASAATLDAVDSYAKIAADNNMSPTELAIAFARTRRFISDSGSIIVGATTLEQLQENLAPFMGEDSAASSILDDSVLKAIDRVHIQSPNPSCHYS